MNWLPVNRREDKLPLCVGTECLDVNTFECWQLLWEKRKLQKVINASSLASNALLMSICLTSGGLQGVLTVFLCLTLQSLIFKFIVFLCCSLSSIPAAAALSHRYKWLLFCFKKTVILVERTFLLEVHTCTDTV